MGFGRSLIGRFLHSRRGNIALTFALASPVVLGLMAGAMDMYMYNAQKAAMQDAADAGALAAVHEAALKAWDEDVARSVADTVARANYATYSASGAKYDVEVTVSKKDRQVAVALEQYHYPYFYASVFPSPQISASATATMAGNTNVCVIGLATSEAGTVSLEDESLLTAPDCAVFSDSDAIDGMASDKKSILKAQLACTAGGFAGAIKNYNKLPITDCPRIGDPLAGRPAPSSASGPCLANGLEVKGGGTTEHLLPGVYCGGLSIKANAEVVFDPGIYVIKDGPLELGANASLYGHGVGIYFTGSDASFSLESGSAVDLEAAKNGDMAGLIFYQDRTAAVSDFLLRSNTASNLLGTIYLPNGNFIIDTNSKVADASAYTAIVARTVHLMRKPNVVLNTDYDATDVPVPAGLGPSKASARLMR